MAGAKACRILLRFGWAGWVNREQLSVIHHLKDEVWTEEGLSIPQLKEWTCGLDAERLARLRRLRNGLHSGQIVVSARSSVW